jgi:hypothetical protein
VIVSKDMDRKAAVLGGGFSGIQGSPVSPLSITSHCSTLALGAGAARMLIPKSENISAAQVPIHDKNAEKWFLVQLISSIPGEYAHSLFRIRMHLGSRKMFLATAAIH